ncbi:TetR/AcrR family transcriptional regulator [Curtobacterium sp. MCBD17_035]|uniref:TetR/AcrR family transcriptional regulator n=1 Tax=Curtobacterium sp. MCBD17_035 TaxID=2175673 RepID=UPI000DA99C9F|nr:TetR/AcrR family transcriptional regulator [Curtobacterium sp. MCBD17_035]WIB67949.1 TetR/AcrR family transcriptional regulator [Curtobacterium sp. MCBD17_035]
MPSRSPRRDAAENRTALVDAARTVLQADPDGSIETIAAAAGLSRRAVYGHFPTRDDLVDEVVTGGARRILGTMPAAAELAPLLPDVRIATIAAALWAEVADVRSLARIALHGPSVDRIASVFAPLRAAVLDACADGVRAGLFRDDVPVESLARLVEGACIAVLDEATRAGTSPADGHRMVVVSALGMAGLDWRSSLHVLETVPPRTPTVAAAAAPAPAPAPASASASASRPVTPEPPA